MRIFATANYNHNNASKYLSTILLQPLYYIALFLVTFAPAQHSLISPTSCQKLKVTKKKVNKL